MVYCLPIFLSSGANAFHRYPEHCERSLGVKDVSTSSPNHAIVTPRRSLFVAESAAFRTRTGTIAGCLHRGCRSRLLRCSCWNDGKGVGWRELPTCWTITTVHGRKPLIPGRVGESRANCSPGFLVCHAMRSSPSSSPAIARSLVSPGNSGVDDWTCLFSCTERTGRSRISTVGSSSAAILFGLSFVHPRHRCTIICSPLRRMRTPTGAISEPQSLRRSPGMLRSTCLE